MLMGFVYAYFILVPSVVPASGAAPQTMLLTLIQLQRLILALGLTACVWFARRTAWRATFVRLAAGAAAGFFFRIVASGAISADRYHEGSVYDLAWIVPSLCYLWGAIEAPRSTPEPQDVSRARGWDPGVISAVPALAIPI